MKTNYTENLTLARSILAELSTEGYDLKAGITYYSYDITDFRTFHNLNDEFYETEDIQNLPGYIAFLCDFCIVLSNEKIEDITSYFTFQL